MKTLEFEVKGETYQLIRTSFSNILSERRWDIFGKHGYLSHIYVKPKARPEVVQQSVEKEIDRLHVFIPLEKPTQREE
jgi:hypothetical protein